MTTAPAPRIITRLLAALPLLGIVALLVALRARAAPARRPRDDRARAEARPPVRAKRLTSWRVARGAGRREAPRGRAGIRGHPATAGDIPRH